MKIIPHFLKSTTTKILNYYSFQEKVIAFVGCQRTMHAFRPHSAPLRNVALSPEKHKMYWLLCPRKELMCLIIWDCCSSVKALGRLLYNAFYCGSILVLE